jgi:phosphate transport system protein
MNNRAHTSRQYESQLRELRDKLMIMSHYAESAVQGSIRALVERKASLAHDVIHSDNRMDLLEIEIDEMCYEILAREHPVARDLRLIATTLKIVGDIERIGDSAVNIAERAAELVFEPELKPLIDVRVMSEATLKMLSDSLDAFVNSDVELAERVISADSYVDAIYDQILRQLLAYMMEDPLTVTRGLKLIFIAKNLERVGDHCANIAEMVVFLVRGEDIRHSASS